MVFLGSSYIAIKRSMTKIKNLDRKQLTMIVPVYNGMPFIDSFLKPINAFKPNLEIIFVDNGSTDGSFDKLITFSKSKKNIRVIKYSNKKSSYAARNEGARNASGKVFLFTDIDCILTESYFESILKLDFSNENLIYTGPTEIFFKHNNIYEFFDKAAYLNQETYANSNYAATANLVVSKNLFDRAGEFPEFTSGGDNKFCKKCFLAGDNVRIHFVPDLKILHPARDSQAEHVVKANRLGVGHAEFFMHDGRSLFNLVYFVIKNLLAIVFTPNIYRVYVKASSSKNLSNINRLKLMYLCWKMPCLQRISMLKTIVLRNTNFL